LSLEKPLKMEPQSSSVLHTLMPGMCGEYISTNT
jgi:hypothetical protein